MSDPLAKRRLRMWLRMLGVTRAAEAHLREYLRVNHATTLPRFDVLAALFRRGEAISMSELSRMLLVSNGNATAVVDRLERDGLVSRRPAPNDRRAVLVGLTAAGAQRFEELAAGHEAEVNGLFDGLDAGDLDTLRGLMQRMRKDRA